MGRWSLGRELELHQCGRTVHLELGYGVVEWRVGKKWNGLGSEFANSSGDSISELYKKLRLWKCHLNPCLPNY